MFISGCKSNFKWGLAPTIFICRQWRRRSIDLKIRFYFVDQIQNILKKFNIFLTSVWIDNRLKSPQLRWCCPPLPHIHHAHHEVECWAHPKLYIPSTLNTNLIIWQPQWIVVAVKCEITVEIMQFFFHFFLGKHILKWI